MSYGLGQLHRLRADVMRDLREMTAAQRARVVGKVTETLRERAPERTGEFRNSLVPYRGAPPSSEQQVENLTAAGAEDVVAGAEISEPVGVASNAPYAGRLATGWSQQAPDGWIDVALEDAVRDLEGEA